MTSTSKPLRPLLLIVASVCGGFLAYAAYANIAVAQFTGPPCTVGNCSGAIGINSVNDLSFGTSTATTTAKVYIVTSTANNTYGLIVRGKIYSSSGGFVFPDGTTQTSAAGGAATTTAANVTPGFFNATADTGGNYSFPASLSVATSTAPSGGVFYVNGKVGIGTATITHQFSNYGSTIIDAGGTGALLSGSLAWSSSGQGWIGIIENRDAAASARNALLLKTAATDASSYALKIESGGTNRFSVRADGNIGIGTITPFGALSVLGSNSADVFIGAQPATTDSDGDMVINLGISRANVTFAAGMKAMQSWDGASPDYTLAFQVHDGGVGNRTVMSLAASGNVGIATTTPGSPLTVAGVVYSSTGGFKFPDGTTQTSAAAGSATTTAANVAAGNFGSTAGTGNYSFPASLSIATSTAPSGGVLYVNGNVGIGVVAPAQKLHVVGGARVDGTVYVRSSGGVGNLAISDSGGGTATVNNSANSYLNILSAVATNFTVGNVGIATTTPGSPLTVAGVVYSSTGGFKFPDGTTQTSAASAAGQATTTAANVSAGFFGSGVSSSGNYSFPASLSIATSTAPSGGVLYVNGNVGIGTASPSATLSVAGSSTISNALSAASAFYVTATGNVGVGTSSPAVKLDVVGGDVAVNFGQAYTARNSAGNRVQLGIVGTGTFGIGNTIANLALYGVPANTNGWQIGSASIGISAYIGALGVSINTNSAERLRIASSGNVGIGTTTPTALLSVGTTTTGLVATFGGGTGKINVGTIDPLYTIGGKRYATYLPGMTGQKEETTGNIQCPMSGNQCRYVIDFNDLEEGSDLWLFAKTTNLVKNEAHFKAMSIVLTPAFSGNVWYEKDIARRMLTVHAEPPHYASHGTSSGRYHTTHSFEISYRLTAPRFDAAQWQNRATDKEEGFNLDRLIR